eukprot:CAMPEP_0184368430 /NCGR_PEP_ID=MMETSP1089-20130417/161657_1 /TAXON_ID=38269 ORGANISM="Gloeochaete wittrockiana, Strain SAG46.84" /NCGR_SAMPLE_ID=MMETSP1089 /ASSEMBLY_ACC=CAM_ASM_000445 /LENGTH=673 /DNA_ID=CAMNT_0026710709 /DNA_START=601 /DNA_END=2623 /DNA_ORIENTATION=+
MGRLLLESCLKSVKFALGLQEDWRINFVVYGRPIDLYVDSVSPPGAFFVFSAQLLYIEELLEMVKKEFLSLFREQIVMKSVDCYSKFDKKFELIHSSFEKQVDSKMRGANRPQNRFNDNNSKSKDLVRGRTVKGKKGTGGRGGEEAADADEDTGMSSAADGDDSSKENHAVGHGRNISAVPAPKDGSQLQVSAAEKQKAVQEDAEAEEAQKKRIIAENLEKMKGKKLAEMKGGARTKGPAARPKDPLELLLKANNKKQDKPAEPEKKKGKQMRIWGDKTSKDEAAKLDFSKPGDASEGNAGTASGEESGGATSPDEMSRKAVPYANGNPSLVGSFEPEDSSSSEEEETEEPAAPINGKQEPPKRGFFSSMLRSLAGNSVIEESDLAPVLVKFKERLMTKNVAMEIADKLCESVSSSLVGQKLATFTGMKSTVKEALEAALVRILTPKRSTDFLAEVLAAKAQKRPYSIVFMGVNGVGKSTNLAKVCHWLGQNNVSCMIAGCDTFRAGAVEQLRVHAKVLQVPLFERGYGKDPATIAMHAIKEAKDLGIDVVLIDTAGRMQDNEPLMRALAKLVHLNRPDLVLFVGEALVGNDAVDQLTKFNKSLADFAPDTSQPPRLVDGIILTKFDTIDDKVGAALSMVYTTGQPIMFVGCGQRYTDLRKLSVKTVVRALLK